MAAFINILLPFMTFCLLQSGAEEARRLTAVNPEQQTRPAGWEDVHVPGSEREINQVHD